MSPTPSDPTLPAAPARPRVEWEETDCLLCGGARWAPFLEAPDATAGGSGLWFAVVRCPDCGLCFTNPRPSEATILQFYPAVYHPHRTKQRPAPRRGVRPGKERQGLPWHGQGRLLDFGCGGGSYLERMHRQGWQVTGLDVSARA